MEESDLKIIYTLSIYQACCWLNHHG